MLSSANTPISLSLDLRLSICNNLEKSAFIMLLWWYNRVCVELNHFPYIFKLIVYDDVKLLLNTWVPVAQFLSYSVHTAFFLSYFSSCFEHNNGIDFICIWTSQFFKKIIQMKCEMLRCMKYHQQYLSGWINTYFKSDMNIKKW